jgi:hypothetical protein
MTIAGKWLSKPRVKYKYKINYTIAESVRFSSPKMIYQLLHIHRPELLTKIKHEVLRDI